MTTIIWVRDIRILCVNHFKVNRGGLIILCVKYCKVNRGLIILFLVLGRSVGTSVWRRSKAPLWRHMQRMQRRACSGGECRGGAGTDGCVMGK
jgi:hypothetical protein